MKFGLFACWTALAMSVHGEKTTETPNVLLIYIDDMGFSDPGCYGNPDVKTLNIDRLAAEGIRFTQYYSNSPVCSPSRVALFTGCYPGKNRFFSYLDDSQKNHQRQMVDWLDPSVPTIARSFKQAGYVTGHFGKWHIGGGRDVGDAPFPSAYGFDEHEVSFEGLGPRVLCVNEKGEWRDRLNATSAEFGGEVFKLPRHARTAHQADMTIDFIRRHKDQPFYLEFFPNDVHTPYTPSSEQMEKVSHLDVHPFLKKMYAVLLNMDEQIGRVMTVLDELDLSNNTLVILTSDNGPNVPKPTERYPDPNHRTGNRRGSKWSLYEGGINLPLIVRWPGHVPAGQVNDETVFMAMDFFPSLCSIVGIDLPSHVLLDGCDMSSAFFGNHPVRPMPVFWEFGRIDQNDKFIQSMMPADDLSPVLMVRDGKWKFLVNNDGSGAELFDFSQEKNERCNMSGECQEITNQMKKMAMEWFCSLPLNLETHDGHCLHTPLQ